ncbi:MAG: ABC transporter permease [Chitinophagaceae bacterium]|nr:ABC transporter permease [Chitinophagaceae bacterium]
MAVEEFRSNKLRTFLSLFGVTIGIFCIISVLSTVNSLEYAIQSDIKSLGSNTIYVDKWEYKGGDDYPWWKYVNRPDMKSTDVTTLQEKVPGAKNIAFEVEQNDKVEYENTLLNNVKYIGISDEFFNIQPVEVAGGRTLQARDHEQVSNSVLMGYTVAEELFGKAEKAIGKEIKLKNDKLAVVVGLIKKQGKSIMEMWDFDNSIILTNRMLTQMFIEKEAQPKIIVQGRDNVSTEMLRDELTGAMRSLRKLKPAQEDNFSLNDIDSFSKMISELSGNVNIGGWAIAALSLVVGMFGVANIMFVTVRERTPQIGLKKALGAKRGTILTEFLLESAFLCILGGMIGLLLVFILTQIVSALLGFPLFISLNIMLLAIGICILVGVLAGIIPASIASKMDPVVAIRSK